MYTTCTFQLVLKTTQSVAILAQDPLAQSPSMLGRPVCVELPAGQVAKVLEDHIHGKLSQRLPYSTHSMRKRARWAEIWKNRSCLADVLTATGGYQMKSTYANKEIKLSYPAQILARVARVYKYNLCCTE